jgi:hypothetical protein
VVPTAVPGRGGEGPTDDMVPGGGGEGRTEGAVEGARWRRMGREHNGGSHGGNDRVRAYWLGHTLKEE